MNAPALIDYLAAPLTVGDPDVAGPLAVFPVFGPAPTLTYLSYAQAVGLGAAVKELPGGASVNDLLVVNPTELPVLLYEGEELLGAQQNRTIDVSVLVPAHAQVRVPVSCVEAGRWDGARHGEAFAPAPQAAHPALRRAKSMQAAGAIAAGLEARATQAAVWEEVAHKSARMGVRSDTGALHDVFESHRVRLADLVGAVSLHDGQVGALAAIGGEIAVLDHVSRPDAFAALHGPLVQGYALDALEAPAPGAPVSGPTETRKGATRDRAADAQDPPPTPPLEYAEAYLAHVLESPLSERDGVGLGREARFASGAALVTGTELVALTAFGSTPPHTRVRRPSQRRSR